MDGVTPYTVVYFDNHQCYSIKALLGQLYSRFGSSFDMHYHDIVSVDAHSQSHTYKQTSFAKGLCHHSCVCPTNQGMDYLCRRNFQVNYMRTNAWLQCGSPRQRFDSATLTIATYNIWNVNSTESQSGRLRLKRLGKVCTFLLP